MLKCFIYFFPFHHNLNCLVLCFCSSLGHWQVEPIRNFFAALFLASIGMLIHVQFLWNHVDILLAAVILVIVVKTIVVAVVVKGFGYTNKTSLLVRLLDFIFYCIFFAKRKISVLPKHSDYFKHFLRWALECFHLCRLECL